MSIFESKKSKPIILALVTLAMSSASFAGTVMTKPGDQSLYAPEFGSALARDGNYIAIGAMQETVAIPGEPIFGNGFLGSQGVVRLFNGSSSTPERIYQFAGNNHIYKKFGAKISMSSKWMAITSLNHDYVTYKPTAVYIVGKTNNQWTQCPTVNSVVDCDTLVSENGSTPVKPIVRITLPERFEARELGIAISDDYLVIGDSRNSKLAIYKYDATQSRWIEEYSETSLAERHLGTAVAIEGDKVAVSSPFFKEGDLTVGAEKGTVKIYKRNTNGVWYISGSSYGHFTEGNYGRSLDMHSGNLVISSGQFESPTHLTFIRVDDSGTLGAPYTIPTTIGVRNYLSVYGDTAVSATATAAKSVVIYKRNPANETWSEVNSLDGALYKHLNTPSNFDYNAVDPVDLVGDDLVLGWRGFNANQGAVIHEKISLIDSCKTPSNLVSNCAFDNSNGSGWQFLNHMGAAAAVNYSGSQLNAVIYYGSNVHWHIQARTAVNLATSGTYKLTFLAKADTYRSITVNLGHNGNQDNNWVSYGQTTFSPGPQWTEFTFEFNGIPADTNAFLDFNLGNAGTTGVSIDGVKLSKLN